MKYTLYYDRECATCEEFIRIFNENNRDVTLKDIQRKVGIQEGAYRWEQIDLTEEFDHPSSFIPLVLMEDEGVRKLFVGGTKEEEIRNVNNNKFIFTSHEDGINKLTAILKKNEKSKTII